jgi:hypothetical protein
VLTLDCFLCHCAVVPAADALAAAPRLLLPTLSPPRLSLVELCAAISLLSLPLLPATLLLISPADLALLAARALRFTVTPSPSLLTITSPLTLLLPLFCRIAATLHILTICST